MNIKAGLVEQELICSFLKVVSKMPSKPALTIVILLAYLFTVSLSHVAARHVPTEKARNGSSLLQKLNKGIPKGEVGAIGTSVKGQFALTFF